MSVKPHLLAIYEKFYIPLGVKLKPAAKGLILGLLPGLEEEGNEFFDRVFNILSNLSRVLGDAYFFKSLWLSLMAAPNSRKSGLVYVLRKAPKTVTQNDLVKFMENTGSLVKALSAALEDRDLLVQRYVLELLVVQFPMRLEYVLSRLKLIVAHTF